MKTAKGAVTSSIKPIQDDGSSNGYQNEHAAQDFLDNCLFVGVMKEEDVSPLDTRKREEPGHNLMKIKKEHEEAL